MPIAPYDTAMPASLGLPPIGFEPQPQMPGMPPGMPGAPDDPFGGGFMGMLDPIAPEEEPEPPPGPAPKAWYRKPKRPRLPEIQAMAEEERRAHAGRIALAMEMVKRLSIETFGYFDKDEELIKDKSIPPAYKNALRAEHDLACAHISGMDWLVEALYRETIDREESAAKEDCASYLFECEARQHARGGNSHIKWALPDVLQKYGMLVGFDAIDPADDECGLRMRLIDPATCFPIHEGNRGLSQMYRIYQSTASAVIGDFGDAAGTVERRVKRIARGNNKEYDPSYMAEVVEYWDRNWVMVIFEGKEILLREHGYARVPFTVTYGCFGQQAFTRTSDHYFVDGSTVVVSSGVASAALRAEDLMRTAQPFLAWRRGTHDIEEAIAGLMIQAFRKSINPPVIHKKSIISKGQGTTQIHKGEGEYTEAFEDDEFEPWPSVPSPEIVTPLVAYMQENRMMGTPSGILNGQMPGAQTSGSALDISAAIGYERFNPLIMVIQQFLSERTEWRLELLRDWGGVLGDPNDLGTMTVPRRRRNARTGNASAHQVTPKLLRDTGIRCTVELHRFNPSTLSQVANGLQILASIGIIDRRSMIKIAGFSADPEAVLQAIDFDDLDAVPEVKQEKTLRLLARLRDQALVREDYESAIDLEQALYFIGSEMERRASIGQPSLGPDGQRLRPVAPGGGGGGAPPQMQGMSMPMMGGATGTNGGRPPGM